MFCNNCGKTIKPDDKVCPHCDAALGDSRFEGSGYTSVQTRRQPGDQPKSERYAPYTRTTYMSGDQSGDDVYARTTYRPVLSEDSAKSTSRDRIEDGDEAAPDTGAAPAPTDDTERPEPERIAEMPIKSGAEDESRADESKPVSVTPLKTVTMAGISPQVAAYAKRLTEQKGKPKRGFLSMLGVRRDEEDVGGERPVPREDGDDDHDEQDGDGAGYAPRPRPVKGIGKIAGLAAGAVAIVALLVFGFIYISSLTAPTSNIPGVSLDLYTSGIELIQSHTQANYKNAIAQLYAADLQATGDQPSNSMAIKFEADKDEISKLYPQEKAMENDQLFIDVLLSIQTDIETAITTDSINAITPNEDIANYAQEIWNRVNSSLLSLNKAKTAAELSAILSDTSTPIATPEPEASPTPSVYMMLTKGDKSVAVERMQRRLRELGWYNGEIDGDFGSNTQTAVKRFQEAIGMEVDGIGSPEFQDRLYAADAPSAAPTARPGEQVIVDGDDGNTGGGGDEVQPVDPAQSN